MKFKNLFIATCIFFGSSIAVAAPVVTFTTSGSAGSWLTDFSIENTLGGTNNIYFFGVQAPTNNVVSTPLFWAAYGNNGATWSNSGNGGSDTAYNNYWAVSALSSHVIRPGQAGSFSVLYESIAAPTSVAWFAYAAGGTYNDGDNFASNIYPGFEGVASVPSPVTPVPEPETYAMLMVGFGLLGFSARRKKGTAA